MKKTEGLKYLTLDKEVHKRPFSSSISSWKISDVFFRFYDFYQFLFRSEKVEEFLKTKIPDKTGVSILDAGCGTGYLSTIFHKADITGIDISKPKINFCSRNRRGNFLNLSFQEIDKLKGKYNFCTCITVFHHVPDPEIVYFLNHLKDKITDTGKLIVIETIMERGKKNFETLMRFIDFGKYHRSIDSIKTIISKEWKIKESFVLNFWCYRYLFVEAGKQ